MPPPPISLDWSGRRAVLLVHGVGNASAGDYASLAESLRTLLGAEAGEVAIYELYYDAYNDWMNDKMPLAAGISSLKSALRVEFGGDDVAELAAEFAGDVIWPILHLAPRAIIREVYLAQLKQMVRDGIRAGVGVWSQEITIICHSLGCFHTYEALHAAATEPAHAMQPLSNGVTFANVIFMASPVQLIRSVCSRIHPAVPKVNELAALRGARLEQPAQVSVTGYREPAVKRWVSISGEMDPVCGYLFGRRVDNCWMEVEGQDTIVDAQRLLNIGSPAELAQRIRGAIRENGPPQLGVQNPHSWQGYVDRHSDRLRQWLTA
jgi:hypothetical protein